MKRQETIRLDNLRIGYRVRHEEHVVAERLTASIPSGELTCLLGRNGAGKSTLLRTLAAFQSPLEGSIELFNRPLSDYTDRELSHRLGVVLTDKCDLTNMTVVDLVAMGRAPYTGFWGRLTPEDLEEVKRAVAAVGIETLVDRKIQTLSDGERQKAMIAKALAQQTPVILLDEPTAFLDYPSKVEIMQLLHRLTREAGKTIFLSTHDLELALQIADRLWLMKRGEPLTTGTPEDLSIDGTLAGFFPQQGIAFEPTTGLFRIENRYHRQVRLTGNGILRAMAEKALRRIGIDPSAEEAEFVITAAQDFTIQRGESAIRCRTIGELLNHIEAKEAESVRITDTAGSAAINQDR